MNYRGRIKLVNGNEIIHSFQYQSREERNVIIVRWSSVYGSAMELYNIQIDPVCFDEEIIKEKSARAKIRTETRVLKMQEESKARNERPPAKYNNLKIYNY